jgi:hypothetical protein
LKIIAFWAVALCSLVEVGFNETTRRYRSGFLKLRELLYVLVDNKILTLCSYWTIALQE